MRRDCTECPISGFFFLPHLSVPPSYPQLADGREESRLLSPAVLSTTKDLPSPEDMACSRGGGVKLTASALPPSRRNIFPFLTLDS